LYSGGFFRHGLWFDFPGEAFLLVLVANENGQRQAENEEHRPQIDGTALQHVGGTGTEHLVGDAGTERRSETFLFRALHQDEQGHQQADKDEDHQQKLDDDGEPFNCS